MKLFHRLCVPCNFRELADDGRASENVTLRALADPFFVVKFHANLFNGSLAIANKRGDELFAGGMHTHTHARTHVCARTHARKCASRTRARSLARERARSLFATFVSHSGEKYKINIVSGLGFSLPLSLSSFPFSLFLSPLPLSLSPSVPFAAIIARY